MLNQKKAASPTQRLLTHSVSKGVTQAFVALSLGIALQACQKQEVAQLAPASISPKAVETNDLQKVFAKALVTALKSEPDLRTFLKDEANKQFDGDYDVLYQFIKDKSINGGASFHERLAKYASATDLASIEEKSPLLTIFIPNLPSGFSPETWNTTTEIPAVAVCQQGSNTIPYYTAEGKEEVVPEGQIPGFPTVVVKQNERVGIASPGMGNRELTFHNDSKYAYYFGDKVFDGIHPANSVGKQAGGSKSTGNRNSGPGEFNPKTFNAYYLNGTDKNVQWQRDYVYYGIQPGNSTGVLDRNMKEFIHTVRLSTSALGAISDQAGDPTLQQGLATSPANFWTEGRFELQFSVLINAKNGIGPLYEPVISVPPQDLYDISYQRVWQYYVINNYTPKEIHPHIPLVAWDLLNYGTSWVFIVSERDATGTAKNSYTSGSSFAANFDLTIPGADATKVGAKFGLNASTSKSETHETTFNLGDDLLGPSILNFDDPVINGGQMPDYTTYEIQNGSYGYYWLSVEPAAYNDWGP